MVWSRKLVDKGGVTSIELRWIKIPRKSWWAERKVAVKHAIIRTVRMGQFLQEKCSENDKEV